MMQVSYNHISIRRPAIAGQFYPVKGAELNRTVEHYLSSAVSSTLEAPKAIVAPHAGYIYSGPIAASVYQQLYQKRTQIERVVLLGPAHRSYVKGIALPSNTHFATPLGNIALDTRCLARLQHDYPFAYYDDAAHKNEHSLEVHLPFLQHILPQFSLIPLLVGVNSPENTSAVLRDLWGGEETLVIISSDLSHYLDYQSACIQDQSTTKMIENLDYQHIGSKNACGHMPLNGLLRLAKQYDMKIQTVDLRNSGDTAGNHDRVVGYGAYSIKEERLLTKQNQKILRNIIKASIRHGLDTQQSNSQLQIELKDYPKLLQEDRAVFVTLMLNGKLRGCIGSNIAHEPLICAAAEYAYKAAFADPRFPRLTAEEYEMLEISLSILSEPKPIRFTDQLDLISQIEYGDGIILKKDTRHATFLPSVWQNTSDRHVFYQLLKNKAKIRSDEVPEQAWHYLADYYQWMPA